MFAVYRFSLPSSLVVFVEDQVLHVCFSSFSLTFRKPGPYVTFGPQMILKFVR